MLIVLEPDEETLYKNSRKTVHFFAGIEVNWGVKLICKPLERMGGSEISSTTSYDTTENAESFKFG